MIVVKKCFLVLLMVIFCVGNAQKKKKNTKSSKILETEIAIIYSEAEAENSKEARVIAGFLKQNPTHAKREYFKRKLVQIIMSKNSEEAKPTITQLKSRPENIGNENTMRANEENYTSKASTTYQGIKKYDPNAISSVNPNKETTQSYASKSLSMVKNTTPSSNTINANNTKDKAKDTAKMLSHMFNYDPSDKEAFVSIKNNSSCNLIVKISGKKYYNLSVPSKNENYIMIDKGEYVLTTMVCDAKYSSVKKVNKDIQIVLNLAE